jgi:hypothetical protein
MGTPPTASIDDAAKLRVLKVAVACCLTACFLACIASPPVDLDVWHEMALIRESLAAGHLLTQDRFAYTPTVSPMVDHEWGAGVILYALASAGGSWPVVVLKYLLALATAALALTVARRRGAGFEALAVLAPLAMPLFGLGCGTLRAHAYTFLFIALLLYFLELDSGGGRRWIPLWLLLFVAWVNIHGGCIMGIVVLALYWAEQVARRRPHLHLLGTIALSFAAMAVNPFGLAYYRHMGATLQMPRPEIAEWWPVWRGAPGYVAVFWITLAIAVYAVVKLGPRASRGALIVAALAAGTIVHIRVVPIYAVVWAAYVPAYVSATPLGQRIAKLFRWRDAVTVVSLIATMFFGVMLAAIGAWRLTVPGELFPVGAVEYLQDQRFHGNVMTPFDQGAYVTWRLFPAVKVSLDSRYDISFPPALANESFRFYRAEPGWQGTLTKYPTDLVLAPRNAALARQMPSTGWKRVYADRWFALYARPGLDLPVQRDTAGDIQGSFP